MILRYVCPFCQGEEWEGNPGENDEEDGQLYHCKLCGESFDIPRELEIEEDE